MKADLYNGDCIKEMSNIPDGSIDMLLVDLPYGVLNKDSEGGSWDSVIPFEPLWEQLHRVCKRNAAMVFFAQGMFTAKLMTSNPKEWRYNLVWDKMRAGGFLNANRMPLRSHEDLVVFYRELPVYHPQKWKLYGSFSHGKTEVRTKGTTNRGYGNYKPLPTRISDEKYPLSIISCFKGFDEEAWLHPTSKPVELLEYLIRTFSDKGDTVLDCTMGSGSTGVAAVNTARNFVGVELEEKYFNIARERIALAQSESLRLFDDDDFNEVPPDEEEPSIREKDSAVVEESVFDGVLFQ